MNHVHPTFIESLAALNRLPADLSQRSRTHILQHLDLDLYLGIRPIRIDLPEPQASIGAFPYGRPARYPFSSHACIFTILIEELHLRHIASPIDNIPDRAFARFAKHVCYSRMKCHIIYSYAYCLSFTTNRMLFLP